MLTAVFRGHAGYVVFSLAVVLTVGAVTWLVLSRRAGGRPWSGAALSGAVAAEVCLTMWSTGGGMTGRCVVNRDLVEPFLTAQGLWNAAMFVPIGLFGMLAVQRPTPVLAGVVLLTVATELAQGVLPVGRGCDTSDVEMNAVGGLLGLAVGRLLLWARGRPAHHWRAGAPQTLAASAAVALVGAVVWSVWITPTAVDGTSLRFADGEQKAAAEQAVRQAFGDRYTVVNVQASPETADAPGALFIALDEGFAELSWPDADRFSASLHSPPPRDGHGFPVPGAGVPPRDGSDALAIARRYATEHYPWALRGFETEVSPADIDGERGWRVDWYRVRDGIVMPARLDLRIGASGQVTDLFVHRAEDPEGLPRVTVGEEDARRALRAHFANRPSPGGTSTIHVHDLTAVRREGRWRAEWPVTVEPFDVLFSVDASTGTVHDSVDARPRAG